MDQRGQIQDFLTSRRGRISPEAAGLPVVRRRSRRVPGLRREEVAALAGVSVDYYTRLERGALPSASDGVLDAIATALRLDAVERLHLFDLARNGRPSASRAMPKTPPAVPEPVQVILDALVGVPALVRDQALDVIAMNDLGRALYPLLDAAGGQRPNLARFTFLNPQARNFWIDWQEVADDFVGHLHTAAGANPNDPTLIELVSELSGLSEDFGARWDRHEVRGNARGIKRIQHPIVGLLHLRYEVMQLGVDPRLTFVGYTAEAGTRSHDSLSLLATWAATRHEEAEAPKSSTRSR